MTSERDILEVSIVARYLVWLLGQVSGLEMEMESLSTWTSRRPGLDALAKVIDLLGLGSMCRGYSKVGLREASVRSEVQVAVL